MNMRVRVLHVSDLHVDARSAFDQRVLVDGLVRDVERNQAGAPFDLIVFSGDLASRGKAEEFEAGRWNLLGRLTQATGLGPERVVLVPGNHDVDRDEIDGVIEDGLRTRLTSHEALVAALEDDRQVSHALGRLAAWTRFTDDYYAGVEREPIAPGGWTRRIEICGVQVGIAALNSAWRSTGAGEDERGRLLVGELQARTALDRIRDCDVRLVAVHHPFEWLTEFDRREVRREFEAAGVQVMTGHEHEADPMYLVSGLGNSNHDRSGCLYFGLSYPNAYSVIDVDVANERTLVNVRTWQAKRREFDAGVDAAKGGVVELPLPRRSDSLVTVPHGNVAMAMVDLILRTSVVAEHLPDKQCSSVSELLVSPRFYPAPFPELAVATMERGEMRIDQADGLGALAENKVVMVIGEPDAGVTAAIAWLLEHRHEADPSRPPLYISFDPRQGKRVIDDDLATAAAKINWRLDHGAEIPLAMVAVDDVHAGSEKALNRLVRHIADHPENRYLLGCHSDSILAVAAALKEADVEPARLFLGPLNRPSEVRQLVRKMLRAPSKALADKVLSVLNASQLPRTPFMMAALTAILHDRPDIQALDPTAVIDRYIDLLLGRTDMVYVGRFDYRRRLHLMEYLAGRFTTGEVESVPRRDAEAWIGTYLDSLGDRKTSPHRLLEEFISRGLLVDVDGFVSFRHPAVQHVLAAKLMREPDQVVFAEAVKGEILTHREVIRHAAALLRNDRQLLVAVAEVTKEVLKTCDDPANGMRLESLVDFGEARELDPKELPAQLKATAPQSPDALEATLDEVYERLGTISAATPRSVGEPEGAARVFAAIGLHSSVVTSSELVTDAELRTDLLKIAIRGWGICAVEVLKQEERTHQLSQLFRKTILKSLSDEDAVRVLDRVVRVSVMLGLLLNVTTSLGSRQIEAVLMPVLRDNEFMADAVNALIAVWLAVHLKVGGWVDELRKLRRHHHKHTFVRELTLSIALAASQSPTTSDQDAAGLEAFVLEVYAEAEKGGVESRQATTSRVQANLRKHRARAKLAGVSGDLLELAGTDDESGEEKAESA